MGGRAYFNFLQTSKPNAHKTAQNVFSKCVLEFNVAPIRSVFLFIYKGKIRCTLLYLILLEYARKQIYSLSNPYSVFSSKRMMCLGTSDPYIRVMQGDEQLFRSLSNSSRMNINIHRDQPHHIHP